MRRPRILARQLRALHTQTRTPIRVPRLRPTWNAPIPWRAGAGIPPRGHRSGPPGEGVTPLDIAPDEDARAWPEGSAIPQRRTALGETSSHADGESRRTLRRDSPEEPGTPSAKDARAKWPEGNAIPRREPRAPRDETSLHTDGTPRSPSERTPGDPTRHAHRVPQPYTHELGVTTLEFRGSTFVHERFEAVVTRQCHPGGSAGVVRVALDEMHKLGLKPRPAFYGAALAVRIPLPYS